MKKKYIPPKAKITDFETEVVLQANTITTDTAAPEIIDDGGTLGAKEYSFFTDDEQFDFEE